jgi:hypothetical protein
MDNQSRDYGQNNFSLPHDVVPLPSQGVRIRKNQLKSDISQQTTKTF